ncbi:MAG: branched-chain amino acid ABC transporter substrate-binding protein [Proteobacteria bacterium]|nr:branched-chain amino acid ABC transporter substrate-binding protein [Pseudomonadota bacterium]
MKKWILTMLAMALVAMLSFGCASEEKAEEAAPATEAAAPAGEIILGVAGAHSGDLASYGLPTINAAELVAKKYNAAGGINGMMVKVLPQDDQCKPEVATNAATKLLSENVNVVIGHICSGATKAALPLYTESKIVVMSPSATSTDLTQSGEYPTFFRTIGYDADQGRFAAEFTKNTLGATKVAVIHDKGDYGKGFAEFAQKTLEGLGGVEVVLFEGITPGAVDYSAVVQKIKQSGADAVIFGGYHPEASKIVTQMSQKDLKIPFVSDDGVKDDTFIKVAGEFAEGVYATGPEDLSANAMAQQAIEEHKATYGTDPGAFYVQAYAAAQALLNAIEKAGSTDYDAIVNVLHNETVETSVGNIKFDAKGDAEGVGFSMYQVQNGAYVVVQ